MSTSSATPQYVSTPQLFIPSKSNVRAVSFAGNNSHHVLCGGFDHNVSVYDISENFSSEEVMMRGRRKKEQQQHNNKKPKYKQITCLQMPDVVLALAAMHVDDNNNNNALSTCIVGCQGNACRLFGSYKDLEVNSNTKNFVDVLSTAGSIRDVAFAPSSLFSKKSITNMNGTNNKTTATETKQAATHLAVSATESGTLFYHYFSLTTDRSSSSSSAASSSSSPSEVVETTTPTNAVSKTFDCRKLNLLGHNANAAIRSIAFSPEGQFLIFGLDHLVIGVFDNISEQIVSNYKADFAPTHEQEHCRSNVDKDFISFYSEEHDEERRKELRDNPGACWGVDVGGISDDDFLYAFSSSASADTTTAKESSTPSALIASTILHSTGRVLVWNVKSRKLYRELQSHSGKGATCCKFVKRIGNGIRFLVSGGLDCQVLVHDVDTAQTLSVLNTREGSIWSVAVSPDSTLVAAGTYGSDAGCAIFQLELYWERRKSALLIRMNSKDGTKMNECFQIFNVCFYFAKFLLKNRRK